MSGLQSFIGGLRSLGWWQVLECEEVGGLGDYEVGWFTHCVLKTSIVIGKSLCAGDSSFDE